MRRRDLAPLLTLLVVACVDPSSDPDDGDERAPSPGGAAVLPDNDPAVPMIFDRDHLLEDDDVLGGADITSGDIQVFLESQGSFLAGYADPDSGASAAEIIADRCAAYDISPLYMLARIQTESSLISSGSAEHLEAATGCGCPDGAGCDPELSGFASQIDCAAYKMRSYITDLDAGAPTIAGWEVGVPRETLDPCEVVPANRATAALYTYTPWVGAYADGCGRADVGGSSLVALVYARFRAAW